MSFMLGVPERHLCTGQPWWWSHDNGWQTWSFDSGPVIRMRFTPPTDWKKHKLVSCYRRKQIQAMWWRGPPFASYVVLPGLIRWRDIKAMGSRDRSNAPSNIQWQRMRESLPAS